MIIRKALVALASAGMVFGSTASAAVRPSDSVIAPTESAAAGIAFGRQGSPIAEAEGLRGSWGWILALIIVAGVIGVIASDGDEDLPESP
jgi:hypothetical protein